MVENKKAYFDYEIIKKYEAGIELLGFEVKSLKLGKASLVGAYVAVRGNEAFVLNMQIVPYQVNNTPKEFDPLRARKLLLSKKEIFELTEAEKQKSLTIVPLLVYNKGKKIKLEIAVVKGKKKFDKRETIKERDTEREIRREFKR